MKTFQNTVKIRQIVAFSLLGFVNLIFAFKYFSRYIDHSLLLSVFYIAFLVALFISLKRVRYRFLESAWFFSSILFLYCLGHVVLFHFISVKTLNVDRWSVISSFWEQVFKGQYPYNALSNMGSYPAPFPFYFLMALPFHIIGEIGYFSLTGIIIFAYFLRKNLSRRDSIGALIILFLSISVFWEITVRSTIFVNSIFFTLYLFWLQRVDLNNKKQYWASALIGGLLLSTRTIFVLPLVIYCVFLFKSSEITLKSLIGWSLIILGVFTLTFSPFFIFYLHEFLNRNPFNVQTEHLFPFKVSVVFFILSVIAGFICSNKIEILYYSCGIFVLILITYFTLFIHRYSLVNAYLKSSIDLSYMLFTFPFLLFFSYKE